MTRVRRFSPRQLVVGLLFIAAFAALFWPTFRWMAERFNAHDSFYSHGWLIPFASGWLIWHRRERFRCAPVAPSYRGLALLIPWIVLHVFANRWDLHVVSGFAMVGAVGGLVWTLWGRAVLGALRFPLLFLLFMVPLPGAVLIAISFKMKLWAAALATHLLSSTGLPALQQGSTIQVPGVSVIVDDTCSGLRSLISLIALSTLWAGGMPSGTPRWQRLAIVAVSMPIAVVANMVRILTLVLLAAIYGPQVADGFIHYGSGLVVFGLALLALAWVHRLLNAWTPVSGHPNLSQS